MEYLEGKRQISVKVTPLSGRNRHFRIGLKATTIDELNTSQGHGIMLPLGTGHVRTGDGDIDKRLGHAKELFETSPRSMERLRSAVIELAAILEPLRADLEKYFGNKDTNVFFRLVNEFDVRHNKDRTLTIEHEEQLEWLYYAFLNTINAYTKLRKRLGR